MEAKFMIAIGSDHAGYELKNKIIEHLNKKGYEVKDFGTDSSEKSVDYPDFGLMVAESVKNGECEKGIVICGTGIGISISANKVPGIRAALCTNSYMARMSRKHNDSNVLALGGRVLGVGLALEIVETWLDTGFERDRHKTRVDKITEIEKKFEKN
jgi:ribose 5-phosphate isomerase B